MDRSRCPDCSAALRPDAQWCGLCFRDLRVVPDPVVPAHPVVPAQPAAPAHQALPLQPTRTAGPSAGSPAFQTSGAQTSGAQPSDAQPSDTGAGTDETAPARQAGWPCAVCSLLVPLQAEACPSCGASFLATMQADSIRQAPSAGLLMRLPRSARLAAAVVLSLVVAVLVPILLTLLG